MASITLTIPMCAVLYLVHIGTTKKADIQRKYNIKKEVIYRLIERGLLTSERKGKYVYLSLSPMSRDIIAKNEDLCRKAFEVLKACRQDGDPHACDEVHYARLTLTL